jgi:hypothetical protein
LYANISLIILFLDNGTFSLALGAETSVHTRNYSIKLFFYLSPDSYRHQNRGK